MRRFTPTHEWIEAGEGGVATVGVTHHAADQLGDVVFVEPKPAGTVLAAGDTAGVIESVKAAADLYAPVAGEVVEVNPLLADRPGLVNEAPEGEGWLFRIRLADTAALDALMDAAAYQAHVAAL
jgi:glycine cleavage system H protein